MRIFSFLLLLSSLIFYGQKDTTSIINSLYNSLTLEEKIGQLIAYPIYSNRNEAYNLSIKDTLQKIQPGFLIYFQGNILSHAQLHNKIISTFKIPPFISMDAENGIGMRIKDALSFPLALTIAATGDTLNAFRVAKAIGEQCNELKIHINYAPVVDVNTNPLNPVIGRRSFGESPDLVIKYARNYIIGLSESQVYNVIKHFPGHGNTFADSHVALPKVKESYSKIKQIHLYTFERLIHDRLAWGVMVGHLYVPALDKYKKPSSLSKNIVNQILVKQFGFRGLIFTDALSMKGALYKNNPGKVEVDALLAGNDVLLMPQKPTLAINSIKEAIQKDEISQKLLEIKVKKVLYYKVKAGLLNTNLKIDTQNLVKKINRDDYVNLKREIYEKSIVLLKNDGILPLNPTKKTLLITVGNNNSHLYEELLKYLRFQQIRFSYKDSTDTLKPFVDSIQRNVEQIVFCFHQLPNSPAKNPLPRWKSLVYRVAKVKPTVLCLLGSPFQLHALDSIQLLKGIILGFENDSLLEIAMAKALVGTIPIQGILPATVHMQFPQGSGLKTTAYQDILQEGHLDVNRLYLDSIDLLIKKAIQDSVMPGCQVMAVWKKHIIYNKCFGKYTYEGNQLVKCDDIYDLASLTKILATTLAIMKLYEEKKIQLETPLKTYLPQLQGTDVGETSIARILTHSAGFPPFIPFYKNTLKNTYPSTEYYSTQLDSIHTIEVAHNLYLRKDYRDSIIRKIFTIKLNPNQGYKYSDLGMIVLGFLIERLTRKPLNEYVDDIFYRPLGLNYLGFCPKKWYPLERIVPTERDTIFRKQLIHGYVHDQTAAMLGGVAGHAGLFGNAYNVAILMQMLLNGGTYRNVRFLEPETIRRFTSTYYDKNYRGLGFDKPNMRGNVTSLASPASFGHSGFTGTFVWADPQHELVFVFLSNRVYPSADNWKITKTNLRTKIHEYLYKAIEVN